MKTFRSRIDFPIVLLASVSIFLVDIAAMGVSVLVLGYLAPAMPWSTLLLCLFAPALALAFAMPVRYTLSATEMQVRSGLLYWKIPLSHIQRAAPMRSLRPAPALSFQRLGIEYLRGGTPRALQISPVTPEYFLRVLAAADPGLSYARGELVRSTGKIVALSNFGT